LKTNKSNKKKGKEKKYNFKTLADTSQVVPLRMLLPSTTAVQGLMKCITDDCGEGIILQRHSSQYIPGRSQSMLKFKVIFPLIF
jgi:hypothetical protein